MLTAACATGAWPAPRATIELLPNAQVQGGTVVLGQVARLHASDLETMRRLVQLPIGRAPQPGKVAVLQHEVLARWIRHETGLSPAQLEVGGSRESQVLGTRPRVRGEDIADAAAQALRAWLAARSLAADIEVRAPVRDVDIAGGEVRLESRPVEYGVPRRHMVLWVDIWMAGALVRTVPVSLEVLGSAAAARADTGAGALLPERPELQPSATRAAEPLAVMRGEWATLRSVAGPVVLEAAVEVLQDGRAGEKVRVRQRGAAALVMARVVGPARLELAP